jgi:hypothetical protein
MTIRVRQTHQRRSLRHGATPGRPEVAGIAAFATAVPPELLACIEDLVHQVRNLTARVEVLEGLPHGTAKTVESEDGRSRPPGRWLRMKAAAKATGRSVSGLKKLCRQGRVVFDDDAPRRLINVDSVPARVAKVPKVPKVPA